MVITEERHTVYVKEKKIEFDINGDVAYSFPTANWETPSFDSEYADIQKKSYEQCMSGVANGTMEGPFHRIESWAYTQPAQGICECGHKIELIDQYMGACECPYCNRWHNMFGQQLLDPEYWEEDL